MRKVTEKTEFNKLLLDNLKYFDSFCRENHIKYSLIGGSLIGAIRHNGMIPWDDDVDVVLMPEEYKKLEKAIARTPADSRYHFCTYENTDGYYYPFIKLVDTKTILRETKYNPIDGMGSFVDVFFWNYTKHPKILFARIRLFKMFISAYARPKDGTFKRWVIYTISHCFDIRKMMRRYNKLFTKGNRTKTPYVVSVWPSYKMHQEIQLAKNFQHYSDHKFDNLTAMITDDYDEVLKTTFGDYMQLPPKSEQKNRHSFEIYMKD